MGKSSFTKSIITPAYMTTKKAQKISLRKPWNRSDLPVWSLSTIGPDHRHNMNICTYVSGVSMKPKRFMVAVYDDTQTLLNLQSGSAAVLQLLARDQYGLVRYLGQRTGKEVDKLSKLPAKYPVVLWKGNSVLADAAAWLQLKEHSRTPAGDHTIFIFDIICGRNQSAQEPLMLNMLRKKGLVRG